MSWSGGIYLFLVTVIFHLCNFTVLKILLLFDLWLIRILADMQFIVCLIEDSNLKSGWCYWCSQGWFRCQSGFRQDLSRCLKLNHLPHMKVWIENFTALTGSHLFPISDTHLCLHRAFTYGDFCCGGLGDVNRTVIPEKTDCYLLLLLKLQFNNLNMPNESIVLVLFDFSKQAAYRLSAALTSSGERDSSITEI